MKNLGKSILPLMFMAVLFAGFNVSEAHVGGTHATVNRTGSNTTSGKLRNHNVTKQGWYTADELRAAKARFDKRLPYDFGMGTLKESSVTDDGVVHLVGNMKKEFSLLPEVARGLFISSSLHQLRNKYCSEAVNPDKALNHVKAIHGKVFDYEGKIVEEQTFSPDMCGAAK